LVSGGNSTLVEELTPQVRNPVGVLPSGGRVLGMADVVVTMDPYVGQSWNNSTRCAKAYLESIMEHGDQPFDEDFLVRTFDRFWEFGLHNQLWSEMNSTMWDEGDLVPHFYDLVDASAAYPEVADRWIQGWDTHRIIPRGCSIRTWLCNISPRCARSTETDCTASPCPMFPRDIGLLFCQGYFGHLSSSYATDRIAVCNDRKPDARCHAS